VCHSHYHLKKCIMQFELTTGHFIFSDMMGRMKRNVAANDFATKTPMEWNSKQNWLGYYFRLGI
jgi:hypothetical protein